MIFVIVFIALFAFSCGEPQKNGEIPAGESEAGAAGDTEICEERNIPAPDVKMPEKPVVKAPESYAENGECHPLPEAENGKLILGEGCYSGCLKVEKKLYVSGKNAENTVIFCDNAEKEAAIEVAENAELTLENISLQGKTRCLSGSDKSKVIIRNSALSRCVKGGINFCPEETPCRAELSVENSFVGAIEEAESGISYGISFENGTLSVLNSEISAVNSFGVAVWGESGEKNKVIIENSIIKNIQIGGILYELLQI